MGFDGYGELGAAQFGPDRTFLPEEIVTNHSVFTGLVGIAGRQTHSLYLYAQTGQSSACGDGRQSSGELGNGTTTSWNSSDPDVFRPGVTAIAAGYVHSLYVKDDGSLWAMGQNSSASSEMPH